MTAHILAMTIVLGLVLTVTQACSAEQPAAMGPGDHTVTLKAGNLERHYTVHVPPGYDGKAPVPVVVMLHGGGGTSKGAINETGWSAKADQAGFLAVYPDATPPDQAKPGQFRTNPQLWNDGSGRFYAALKSIDDIAFLGAMLDDLEAKFAVDRRRIFVTGFSNGASMTFRVGAELSQRVAAIAPIAGACWQTAVAPARPIPMLYITGTADPLNPLEGGELKPLFPSTEPSRIGSKPPVRDSIQKWVKALGCPAAPKVAADTNGVRTETYGPGSGGAEVVFITVPGMGHTWAGGKSLLPEFMVGKTSDKIRATDVIWDFFQRHPAPQPEEGKAAEAPRK